MAEQDPGGTLGAITARGEAHILRYSVAYALTDGSATIEVPHLEAAWALWQYAFASAEAIFGNTTGDPHEHRLRLELERAGEEGLDRTGIYNLFGRHLAKTTIDALVDRMEKRNEVETVDLPTGGRPRKMTRLVPEAKEAKEARKGGLA